MARRRTFSLLSITFGLALLAFGATQRGHQQAANTPKPSPSALVDPSSFPSPIGNLVQPPPGLRIKMVDLGIDLPVVAGDGWDAPFYKAATYPGLSLPGEGSRSVIYAHARSGMFGALFRARVGQSVDIDEPDGSSHHFRVTEYYPSWPSSDIRWLQPLAQEQLVLVTCTTYNPNDPRIVVVAQPA